jgi:hypothetical protein
MIIGFDLNFIGLFNILKNIFISCELFLKGPFLDFDALFLLRK